MTNTLPLHSNSEMPNLDSLTNAWLTDFLAAATLAGLQLTHADFHIEKLCASHTPTRLLKGHAAVYVFLFGDRCLKVGRAGENSNARYRSQHYTGSAKSTLAGSLLKHEIPWLPTVQANQTREWICKNTSRINFLLKASHGPFPIGLLEAFLHCKLQPVFEGFASQRLAGECTKYTHV
ncbi:hypothetical protein GBK02_02725 [Dechloromonas sp. TW-R-39-2]|uniref:hypothetical protein n=1 Tax=Dechloromonas sp. TW-R-39-2 TaxID=2654218 RepID=UPI00193CF70E|nr:hypothetical protein [Dechloromonas sp. TW-R-39-2]QRM18388.1 hypothetical protein GBK02_02725 [Dechloromonas sp. TW-R-39-2]